MRAPRRFLLALVLLLGAYLALLLGVGLIASWRLPGMIEARLGEALDAEVTVESATLELIRGNVDIRGLHIEREAGGHVDVTVERAHASMAGFGWVVINRAPHHVDVHGVRMAIDAQGALALHSRERKPLHMGSLALEDVDIAVMPSAMVPGLGRVEMQMENARTGPLAIASAIDWAFAVRTLDAKVMLPGGFALDVRYGDGQLAVGASVLGAEVITVPFELPEPAPLASEAEKLGVLVMAGIKALGKEGLALWLKYELTDRVRAIIHSDRDSD